MNHKRLTIFCLILFLATIVNTPLITYSSPSTIIQIIPQYPHGSIIESLIVNITIQDVTNLHNWQVVLKYNPHIVECTEIVIPSNNIFSGYTTIFGSTINNVTGLVEAFHGLLSASGVSGSGILCSITFQPISPGISALSFIDGPFETYIRDPENDLILPFNTEDGAIQVDEVGFNLYTFPVTSGGTPYNITIFSNSTITNFQFNATGQQIFFDVSGSLSTTGSCSLVIPTPVLNGTFAALLDNLSIYHSISNNSLNQYLVFNYQYTISTTMEIEVLTTITGDLDGNRKIEMRDIAIAAKAFGSTPGNTRWDPRADITGPDKYPDGIVDMRDIALVASKFGDEW